MLCLGEDSNSLVTSLSSPISVKVMNRDIALLRATLRICFKGEKGELGCMLFIFFPQCTGVVW